MKILTSSLISLGLLCCVAPIALADRVFNSSDSDSHGNHGSQMNKVKTGVKFGNGGAKIELCPTGNCDNGQLIMLSMSRLEEIDSSNRVVQKSANFASMETQWTALEVMDINGVSASTTSFVTTFTVKDAAEPTSFNLTATIFSANGTAQNGNQTIHVPAGALKFSVTIAHWPFQDPTNRLSFGVMLKARGKGNGDKGAPSKGAKGGNHTHMDRVDMGEGMFMDAPTLAVIDGVDTAINATIETTNSKNVFVWTFPRFVHSVYYDPVVGSDDTASSTTPSTTKPTTSSAIDSHRFNVGSVIMTMLATAVVALAQ